MFGDSIQVVLDDLAILSQVASHRLAFQAPEFVELADRRFQRFLDQRPFLFGVASRSQFVRDDSWQ